MEIGGYDIEIENNGRDRKDVYAVACLLLRSYWENLIVEDGVTGENFGIYLHDSPSIFIYKNKKASELWEKFGLVKETENTMVHILYNPESVTIVVDDKNHKVMKSFIDSMRVYLSDSGLCI